MMTRRQNVRPYIKVFEDLGIKILDTEVTGHCHYKITVTLRGRQKFFIAPRSASDYRSLANFRSDVRRWKRSLFHKEFV